MPMLRQGSGAGRVATLAILLALLLALLLTLPTLAVAQEQGAVEPAPDGTAPDGTVPSGEGAPAEPAAELAPELAPDPSPVQIVTLDQEQFFRLSAYGKAALARAESDAATLSAENRQLEAALEAEEKALTDRRPTVPAAEFAGLAEAFDAKVEAIRSAQDTKSRAISRQLEEDRQRFFEAAVPILADLLRDTGAVAILADDAIILSLSAVDVTDQAVARMDAALPDGTAVPLPDMAPQIAPQTAPQDAPAPAP